MTARIDDRPVRPPDTIATIKAGRGRRLRVRAVVLALLAATVLALFLTALMVGQRFYPIDDVVGVVFGQTVPGASFTVGELRLPRACLAALAGVAFGMAGVTFQTLLRNPLASPDIVGITQGASAAAVIAIVVLGLSGPSVSVIAVVGALAVAAVVYGLSTDGGFAATRLILVGIGLSAMLTSVVSYVLSRSSDYEIATALRWLSGSLSDASWNDVRPLAAVMVVVVPVMLLSSRHMAAFGLGDDTASGLGVHVERTRLVHIVGSVLLLATATSGTGPISFLAFMSGPIAARLLTRAGGSMLIPAGLVGAVLTLSADLIGQFALPHRYPVGVVTGVLGAPFLIYLLIRVNRSGGTL